MTLTDLAVRSAKARTAPFSIAAGRGLTLLVPPTGGKWWRFRYRFGGKAKMLSIGTYQDVGLKDARERRDEMRKLLASGIDPGAHRKAAKAERAANSFEAVTREWIDKQVQSWTPVYGTRLVQRFERDIFPRIGERPIAEIRAPELLAAIRPIEARGAIETAHRALRECGQVFRYAVATGRADRDVAADLRGALKPLIVTHHAAVTEPAKVAMRLRQIDGYQGSAQVAYALRLAPLLFVRPGELRKAEGSGIAFNAAEWRYTVTKTGTAHIVPLATQAFAILRDLHALTGKGRFVFPSARTNARAMSDNAVLAALRRLGIAKDEMTGHGFRAMAHTILDEVLGFRPDFIEHQLAHAVHDPNGRGYNRAAAVTFFGQSEKLRLTG